MKTKLAIWAGAVLLATGTATAADTGMFFDLSAGQSSVENVSKSSFDSELSTVGTVSGSKLDKLGNYWALSLGYRFLPYLAADIGWANLGDEAYSADFTTSIQAYTYRAKVGSSGPTSAIIGILPINKKFELRARAGLFLATTSIHRSISNSVTDGLESSDEDSTEFFASAAAAYNFTPKFSIYLGAHHFHQVGSGGFAGEADVNGASLGVTFRQ